MSIEKGNNSENDLLKPWQEAAQSVSCQEVGTASPISDSVGFDPHVLVRAELERVLRDESFATAPTCARFLRYLVEQELAGEGSFLKELTIAVGFFGRRNDVDLTRFAGVRVTAAEVRKRLRRYYRRAASTNPKILLPKGTYRPDYVFAGGSGGPPAADAGPVAAIPPMVTFPQVAKLQPLAYDLTQHLTGHLRKSNPGIQVHSIRKAQIGDGGEYDYVIELALRQLDFDTLQLTAAVSDIRGTIVAIEGVTRRGWEMLVPDLAPLLDAVLSGTRINSSGSPNERWRLTRDFIDLVEANTNLEQRTPGGLTRAVQLFDSILSRNAADCAALAGSAQLLLICHHYSEAPASECWNQALARARSAVQLEARSPEANVALAYATVLGQRDFKEGERLFQFALSLNPENHRAHHWLCNLLGMCGRTVDALAHAEAALKLKPDSPIVWKIQGDPLYYAGRFDEAIERYSTAIENRANWTAYVYRGLAMAQRRGPGDVELAALDLKKAARMNPGAQHEIDGAYGFLCAAIGDRSGAESVLGQLMTDARPGSPLSVAAIYAGLGDPDRSFEWVEKALGDPNESLFWFGVDPRFGNLRADIRFAEIAVRLGLPQNHMAYVP